MSSSSHHNTFTLTDNKTGKKHEVPVIQGSEGPPVLDIRHLNQHTGMFTYDPGYMHESGEHCSMTERRADEATRDAVDWLKCEYMQDRVGEMYNGIITSVTSFGIFVELQENPGHLDQVRVLIEAEE